MVRYLCNPLRLFLIFTLTSSIAIGAFSTIDLLYLIEKGLTFKEISLLAIALNVFVFLLEIPTGIISDKISPTRAVMIGTILRAFASLLYVIAFQYHFYIANLCAAIGIAFISGSMNAAILNINSQSVSNEKSFSYLSFYKSAGLMIGGIIGYILFSFNIIYPWIFSAIVGFIACLIVYKISPSKYLNEVKDKEDIKYLSILKQLVSKPIFWSLVFFATSAVAPMMLWQILFKNYQSGVVLGYILLQMAILFSSKIMIKITLSENKKQLIMFANVLCILGIPLFKNYFFILSALLFIHVCLHIIQSICIYAEFHQGIEPHLHSTSESFASAFDSILITVSYLLIGVLMDYDLIFLSFTISAVNSMIALFLFIKHKRI